MKDLVSVIIPTYNRAALLKEAVVSVYNQTYRPIECIVVDDGSTDNTAEVMKTLETLNGEGFVLKYIQQPNSGAQVARNTGTAAANGAYIQYLDSDDLLYPEKLRKQVAYLHAHQECDAVFGDWESGFPNQAHFIKAYAKKDLIFQILTLERSIANFSILMRLPLIKKIGEWDINVKRCQEIDFHLRGLLTGGIYHYQPLNTGLWRYHENERIHNQTGLKEFIKFYQKWETELDKQNLFTDPTKQKIADWYIWFIGQSTQSASTELIPALEEAIRLNPSLKFYNTPKMKLLRFFVGKKNALRLWLRYYLRN